MVLLLRLEINHSGHNHDRYGLRIDFTKLDAGNLTMRFLQRQMFLKKINTHKLLNEQKR